MSAAVKKYQKYLNSLGYKLAEDGIWGKRTQAAYEDAVDRGLVTAQRSTSKQPTSKPKLVPKQLSDYELMADASNKHFAQYPVEAIQDWGDYKTVRDAKDNVYTVEDIKSGKYKYKGNVPAYIENGVLKAGPVPTDLAYNDYVNDNALANYANKLAMDEYLKSEYSPVNLALTATGLGAALNMGSPANWIGVAKDIHSGKSPYEVGKGIVVGNSGIVSDEYMQEHPYMGNALNMGFDLLTYNAPAIFKTVSSMFSPNRIINSIGATYDGPRYVIDRRGVGAKSSSNPNPNNFSKLKNPDKIEGLPIQRVDQSGAQVGRYMKPGDQYVELRNQKYVQQSGGRSSYNSGTRKGDNTYRTLGSNGKIRPESYGGPGTNPIYGVQSGDEYRIVSTPSFRPLPVEPITPIQFNPFVPHWTTTGATLSLLPKTYGPDIVGVPYHHVVVTNFHSPEWIQKFINTPEGEIFWHNGKSYIKAYGDYGDRFVVGDYNDGQTPDGGRSVDQIYNERSTPKRTIFGTNLEKIERVEGEIPGNTNYNDAVNRNTGKREKSKVTGK